jgi:hypothetical protein
MPFVTVGTGNGADIEIHYNDHGTGKPIVLIEVPDGPHNIGWTFPDQVNPALLEFLSR